MLNGHVVAVVQARMSSSRLPGKVLEDLDGRPVIGWVATAAAAIPGVEQVAIATSDQESDDPLAAWCRESGIACVRGPLDDVLARYHGAARETGADIVLRLTADCPFLDPTIAGQVLALLQLQGADYATNTQPPTWPDGLDCEAFTAAALDRAAAEATRPSEREHVTPYFYNNRQAFRMANLRCPIPDLEGHRWTVDDPEDLARARRMAPALEPGPAFTRTLRAAQAVQALPQAARNEGFTLSVAREPLVPSTRFERSNRMLETALRRIPIGSQTFSKSHMQVPAPEAPQFVTHGRGGRIWDVDGNEYVDMMMSLLPVLLGYADAEVDAAIVEQLDKGIIFSMPSPLEAEVAELIAETIPSAEQVRFGKNGSDATAGAVRLARAITGRDHVIACGYHGWQDWYIGGTTRNAGVPQAVRDLIRMVPYNDLAALEQALETNRDQVAAVIMEPMNVAWPRDGYLAGVRDLAHRHGALLIFDEIITGFRFAAGGAQELFGVTPDLTALGKGMANGMPLSAVVGPADLMKTAEEIFFSFTAGGEALSLAAAKATIAKVRAADVPTDLDRKGQILTEAVEAEIAANDLTGTIGLAGHPCWKILTVQDHEKARKEAIKTLLIKEMMVRGILVNASHNLCFAHDRADLERVTAAYRDVLPIVADELSTGRLEERLSCPVIEPVFKVR